MEIEDTIELISNPILIIGVLVDHLLTNIGIYYGKLNESNIITLYLINNGLWNYVDVLICLSLILFIHIFKNKIKGLNISILPFISGVIRLMAGMHNLILLL